MMAADFVPHSNVKAFGVARWNGVTVRLVRYMTSAQTVPSIRDNWRTNVIRISSLRFEFLMDLCRWYDDVTAENGEAVVIFQCLRNRFENFEVRATRQISLPQIIMQPFWSILTNVENL